MRSGRRGECRRWRAARAARRQLRLLVRSASAVQGAVRALLRLRASQRCDAAGTQLQRVWRGRGARAQLAREATCGRCLAASLSRLVVLRRLREWLLEAHAAASWGDAAALEQLLRCDGDGRWRLLRRDAALFADLARVRSPLEGRTLAHAAALAENHSVGALEVALAWGANVDALDRMGQGALHLAIGAAADAQLPVAMRVLAASAHAPRMLRRADAEGRAPLDVALDGHLCWGGGGRGGGGGGGGGAEQ